jgi:hypothetical protein
MNTTNRIWRRDDCGEMKADELKYPGNKPKQAARSWPTRRQQ